MSDGHGHRDAGLDRGLPGGDLAGAGLEHLAHDHVLDLVAGDAGALQGRLDGDAAELGAGEALRQPSSLPMGVRAPATMTDGFARIGEEPPESGPRGALWGPMGVLPRYRDVTANRPGGILVITRIDHVGVAVADLDEAKAFYARTLAGDGARGGQRGAGRA